MVENSNIRPTAIEPGLADGITPQVEKPKLLPQFLRNLDKATHGRVSELLYRADTFFHGESGRERFSFKSALPRIGLATGAAFGANFLAPVVQERMIDRSSAIVHAAEMGFNIQNQISPEIPTSTTTENKPQYVLGFASLKSNLGTLMGDPLENERPNPENGDSLQKTTKGLSYYNKAENATTFTNGYQNWAQTDKGLVTWFGDSTKIPADAEAIDPPALAEQTPQVAGIAIAEPGNVTAPGEITEPTGEGEIVGGEIINTPLSFEQKVAIEREKHPVYTQFVEAAGTIIKAPASVDPKLLNIAQAKTEKLLSYRPDIRDKLVTLNIRRIIIPKNMQLTQLPEYMDKAGKLTTSGRKWEDTRGIASDGLRPSASGEENLKEDIGIGNYEHEEIHNMQLGFTPEDNRRLRELYIKYQEMGIFGDSYVVKNEDEFVAVFGQIYTGGTTDQIFARSSTNQVISTPDDILIKTPDVYQFLSSIFGSREGK